MRIVHQIKQQYWLLASLSLLIAGCVGIGVVETDDPFHKLNDAESLFQVNQRALIAENLIWEAKEIGESEKNYHLLGNAYYTYARFLVSPSVEKWKKFYLENGFKDESIAYDNRQEKAKEYLAKAADFYETGEQQLLQQKKYDQLTNLYINAAGLMKELGNDELACGYLDNAIEAYEMNIESNPQADPYAPPGYESLKEFLEVRKKSYNCF